VCAQHKCVFVYMCVCARVCVYIRMYVFLCVCVCVCVCVCCVFAAVALGSSHVLLEGMCVFCVCARTCMCGWVHLQGNFCVFAGLRFTVSN